ncbi:MAG: hypothetical protein ACWA41_06525 [Putridiphycobacter sp.]
MVLIVVLIILTYVIFKWFKNDVVSQPSVVLGWGVKLGYSGIFYGVVVYYYGNGHLYGDPAGFMHNAKILYQLALDHPLDYIKLWFGMADYESDVLWPYMEQTNIFLGVNKYDYLNDNRLIIKFNSLIYFLSQGQVWVHLLFHAFLAYLGTLLIFKSFKPLVNNPKGLWWALVLLPSLGFWGGGLTKSSFLLLGLGLFFYGIHQLFQKKYWGVLWLLWSAFLLVFNKPYIGLVVLPSTLFIGFASLCKWRPKLIFLAILSTVMMFTILLFEQKVFKLTERVSFKQQDMINIGKGGIYFINDTAVCFSDYKYLNQFEMVSDSLIKVNQTVPSHYKPFGTKEFFPFTLQSGSTLYPHYLTLAPSHSYFEVPPIGNSRAQLLLNTPRAFVDVHLRPFPWDNGSALKYFSFIQNIGLLFLLGFSIFNRKKGLTNHQKWWIFNLMFYIVFITLIIGWTTPVFGAIARYKMAIDLFIVILAFIFLKPMSNEKV